MPESDPLVRETALRRINTRGVPAAVLDIGTGHGFYARTCKELRPDTRVFGLEIWPAYLSPHYLYVYETVFVADMLRFDYRLLDGAGIGLVILADVLEHVERAEAIDLVSRLKTLFPWMLVTLPVLDCPQDEVDGNPYEAHRHQWDIESAQRDLGLELVEECGLCACFEWRRAGG